MNLEKLDRRAFLRGLTVTSAGLLVPKAVQVFMPSEPRYVAIDFETLIIPPGMSVSRIHDSIMVTGNPEQVKECTRLWSYLAGQTLRTSCTQPNEQNIPRPPWPNPSPLQQPPNTSKYSGFFSNPFSEVQRT